MRSIKVIAINALVNGFRFKYSLEDYVKKTDHKRFYINDCWR